MNKGWRVVKLRDVCEIQRGGSPRPISDYITEAKDGINWIKIGDVAEGAKYLFTTKEKIKPEGVKNSRLVKSGDFLLSNSMSFGRPYILRTTGCIHDGWLVLRDKENQLDEDYLYHVLSSDFVYAQFKKFAVGAVVKNLNIEVVEKIEIPLPLLPEQRRIAAILDKADALRVKRREALAQLGSLTQSIFIEMFGDPVTNPKGWTLKKLNEITVFENGDRSSNYPSGDDIKTEGILFLSTKNITNGRLNLSNTAFINHQKFASLSRGKSKRYDLIITLRGTLGSCCIFDCLHETGFINAQMMIIRPKAECHHTFLHALITSKHAQERLASLSRGAAVPQLTATQLADFPVPCPPIANQVAFAKRKDSLDKLKMMHENACIELDNLFASLQHRAFRGEL